MSQNLINSVSQDTDLIAVQKTQLDLKMASVDTLMNNINLLKDKDTEMTVLSGSRLDSLTSTKAGTEGMQFDTYIYIGICVLLLIVIVGLMFYIVYTGYSTVNSQKNNTTSKSSNTSN